LPFQCGVQCISRDSKKIALLSSLNT
jgi:hypothetical protein